MGIVTTLIERSRPSGEQRSHVPGDPASSGWFLKWFGGGGQSEAGVYVSEATALNSLLVMSCVRILAETVATLPLITYRRRDDRGRDRARQHSVYPVLHAQPNRFMSNVTWLEMTMAHLALWGNAYSEIEWGRRGDVLALYPHHPRRVQPYMHDGELFYEVTYPETQTTVPLPARDMLHIPGLVMDGVKGLSPLSTMRQALGLAVQAEAFGARFFANDARPSVLLKHPGVLTDSARTNLRQSWVEMHGGDRRGGIAILEEGLDVSAFGLPPGDAQFLETRRFQVQEMARYFRIPPHLLADVERSTSWGSGIEQQNLGFVILTMRPWLVRIEAELNRKLFRDGDQDRYYAEFLIDGLLRGDLASRKDFYASARQWGYMSANDVLELENRNPIPNGDIYLQPMNMVEAGADPLADPQPPGNDPEPASQRTGERRARPMESREQRSQVARQRLAIAATRIYRDVIARTIDREIEQVGAAARRMEVDEFRRWVGDYYYETLPPRIVRAMLAPAVTLASGIAAEAADELDSDPPDEARIEAWAAEYVAGMAKRHAGASRSRLLKRLNDLAEGRQARQDSDLESLVDEELEEWPGRADIEAQDESHRTAGYIAMVVYGWLGVQTLRWIATGSEPCEFCQAMDGTVVDQGQPFLGAGEEFAPDGIDAFVSLSSVSHPPLHSGCQCVIAPG